jgi:dienelactone hydrolase
VELVPHLGPLATCLTWLQAGRPNHHGRDLVWPERGVKSGGRPSGQVRTIRAESCRRQLSFLLWIANDPFVSIFAEGLNLRHLILSLLAAFAGALPASSAFADVPALYGRADDVWDAQISPSGRYVALGCSPGGWPGICVFDAEVPGDPRILRGPEGNRMLNFYWASDRHLVSNSATFERLAVSSGLQDFEFRRAISFDVTTGKAVILLENVGLYVDTTQVVSTCYAKPDKIMMQLTTRPSGDAPIGSKIRTTKGGFVTEYYEVDLNTGRGKLMKYHSDSVIDVVVDQHCNPIVNVIYNDQRGEFALETGDKKRRFFELKNTPVWPMDVMGLSDDRQSVVVQADYAEHYGLHRIRLSDGAIEPMKIDGEEVGNLGVLRDPVTDAIIGFSYIDDLPMHTYTDPQLDTLQQELTDILQMNVRIVSMSSDRSMMTISAEAAGKPIQYFLYDAAISELSALGNIAPYVAVQETGSVTEFSYAARDGLEISAYLTLPPGKNTEDGPFPVIVMPHGGPEARDYATFDWWPQAYAAAGYAVVQPNFRGSSGYGSDFRDAGFGEFGGKMIDDIVDAIGWAETSGLSKGGSACVLGASYGGYAALMSALRASGKVSCVVAVAPVTDIFAHMGRYGSDSASYKYWERYVGGNKFSTPEMRKSVSPVARTAEYSIPVMLMHGKSDMVVEFSQSQNFAKAWGARGGLTFVEMEGQDHHVRSTKARHTILSESLRFLDANHPGRR